MVAGEVSSEKPRTPTAFAVKVSPIRQRGTLTHWLITVECPYGCRQPHVHGSGGPTLRANHGARSAHCRGRSQDDYTIVILDALLERASP